MKRAHTDEEIIQAASQKSKTEVAGTDDKIDIAVDLDDSHGVCHTYVVTYKKEGDQWSPAQVSELSSL
ncbi:hypothetical protein [Arcticibacter sp. MXS-1]|uniref:hypothetical protein n=1 Tax=Arcticibacter sp. MXS-1 TaxID=3341726 RepID=UPI0035A882C5